MSDTLQIMLLRLRKAGLQNAPTSLGAWMLFQWPWNKDCVQFPAERPKRLRSIGGCLNAPVQKLLPARVQTFFLERLKTFYRELVNNQKLCSPWKYVRVNQLPLCYTTLSRTSRMRQNSQTFSSPQHGFIFPSRIFCASIDQLLNS